MFDLQETYIRTEGAVLICGSIVFGIWFCLWIMLYGGIMQAVENFGVNNPAVVWGIIRAIFASVGSIPSLIGIVLGVSLLDY